MQLDLGDSVSVQTFASDVSSQFRKIDCLICNAGVLVPNVPNDIAADHQQDTIDENIEETAVWYPENDDQSWRDQIGQRYILMKISNMYLHIKLIYAYSYNESLYFYYFYSF